MCRARSGILDTPSWRFLWVPITRQPGSRCCIVGYIPTEAPRTFHCHQVVWSVEGGGVERMEGSKGNKGLGVRRPLLSPPVPPKVISEALFQNWLGAQDGVDGPSSRCENRGPSTCREGDVFSYRFAKSSTYRIALRLPAGRGSTVEINDIKGTSHPSKPYLISVLVVWPSRARPLAMGRSGQLGPPQPRRRDDLEVTADAECE